MNYRMVATALLVGGGILGCDQRPTGPISAAINLVNDRSHAPGHAVLQGRVLGALSDSLPDTASIRIGGARVEAYLLTFSGAPTDTTPIVTLVETVTTDSSGKFRLAGLPGGQYLLVATPPIGSQFMIGQGSATAGPSSASRPLTIVLQLIPPPSGDSLPPPPDSLPTPDSLP